MRFFHRAGLTVAVLLLAAVLPSSMAQTAQPRADATRLMSELMSGKAAVGGPFTLTDHLGQTRSLAEFEGKLVLIYFGYMFCPDICPTDLANIARLLVLLEKDSAQVQTIFITLDPTRDTQELIGQYVGHFDKRILGLRGTESQTKELATQYKTFYEKVRVNGQQYLVDHTAFIYLMNRAGKYVAFFPPGTTPERMATMVREELSQTRP
jgi:cytochrome oxidase Cu insertion factor (SCO1/SenC/PrrC family)